MYIHIHTIVYVYILRIALTVDDAPGVNATGCVSLLDLLEELELNATFFNITMTIML